MFRRIDPSGPTVTIEIDGVVTEAALHESLAAVLLRTPPFWARTTVVGGVRRGPYCMMGACFDCLVTVDGETSVQSCLTPVRAGMRVRRQHGRPRLAL